MKKFHRAIINEAKRLGFKNLKILFGRRHPRLTGIYHGQAFIMVIPGTPGDHRTFHNIRAVLRRYTKNHKATV